MKHQTSKPIMNAGTSPLFALVGVLCVAVTAVPCLADIKDDFVKPPLKFRARPLWFWNNTAVTSSGIGDQLLGCRDRAGYGGLAPLPFGDKFTPKYLSEEYFDLYGVAVRKARELGMFLTIYDEYGFPSGSAGAAMGDGIPRFKNKYPEATLYRAHGRVWTDKFNEKFRAVYGFSPAPYYPALWYDAGFVAEALKRSSAATECLVAGLLRDAIDRRTV